MVTEGERIATLEAVIGDLRGDMSDLKAETLRTRTRLHDLEGLAGALVSQERQRNRDTRRAQLRTDRRLQILTVVIAAAALLEPFLYHAAAGG